MSPEKKKSEESSAAKYALIGTIITAIIGLVGTAITLYFQTVVPTKITIQATQTAEARQTHIASIILSATPTHTQTVTPLPPTPIPHTHTVTATVTISPTSTRTSTPTPVFNGLKFCVNVRSVNVRIGPDFAFESIGYLTFEDCLFFDGRNEAGTWLRVESNQLDYLNLGGSWVRSDLVRPQDFDHLPVLESPPTPTPIPTETQTPTPEG